MVTEFAQIDRHIDTFVTTSTCECERNIELSQKTIVQKKIIILIGPSTLRPEALNLCFLTFIGESFVFETVSSTLYVR